MKSLDINRASTNFSAYNSRQFLIEFTGGNFTERLQKTATHKVIVPYGSLSKKLKTIQRLGSKVVNVSIHPQPEVIKVKPENVALINEVVEVAEITSEAFPESILQTISEITHKEVSDVNSETSLAASPQVITPKSQVTKDSSNLGRGFNKSKSETKSPRSSKQPKS
jgi:hypothetical protein